MDRTRKSGIGVAVAMTLGVAAAIGAGAAEPSAISGGSGLVADQASEITVYKSPT